MKEKTKKILAGIGVGLTLGTAGAFMTGCSDVTDTDMTRMMEVLDNADKFMADISSDIDKVSVNIENSKTLLMEYLTNALENYQYSYETILKQYGYSNYPHNEPYFETMNIKRYYDATNKTLKIYHDANNDSSDYYKEITLKENGKYDISQYNIKNKTYYIENDRLITDTFEYDYLFDQLTGWESLYGDDSNVVSVSHEIMDENKVKFTLIKNDGNDVYSKNILEFDNGKLIFCKHLFSEDDYSYQVDAIQFNYDIEAISFDKSGYSKTN